MILYSLQLLLCLGAFGLSAEALSLPLEHAFGSGTFSAIGQLESPPQGLRVRVSWIGRKHKLISVQDAKLEDDINALMSLSPMQDGPPHLEIKRRPFTAAQRAAFEQLVSDDG